MKVDIYTLTWRRMLNPLRMDQVALVHLYNETQGYPVIDVVQHLLQAGKGFYLYPEIYDSLRKVRTTDELEWWVKYWSSVFRGGFQ